jgi:hypothetical protein
MRTLYPEKSLVDQHLRRRLEDKIPRARKRDQPTVIAARVSRLHLFRVKIQTRPNRDATYVAPLRWLPATIVASADEVPRPRKRNLRLVSADQPRVKQELGAFTVAEMRRDSDLSRTEFSRASRVFKQFTGETPAASTAHKPADPPDSP